MAAHGTELIVEVLDRPKSCSIASDIDQKGQVFTCAVSRDGDQCNLCKSLISFSSGSQLSDCQRLSISVKRETSSGSYSGTPLLLQDFSATPPASRGNTLKTLCSLIEEAVDNVSPPKQSIASSKESKNLNQKLLLRRNMSKGDILCFATDFPAECCFLTRMTFSEEDWSAFIEKLNDHCAKINVLSNPRSYDKFFAFLGCCFSSSLERHQRVLQRFMNDSNKKIFNPCGLEIKFLDDQFETLEIGILDDNYSKSTGRIGENILVFPQ